MNRPGLLDAQACGENHFTTRTLGMLAWRPDLRRRFVSNLLGTEELPDGDAISVLFFSRIGENFFREAIERAHELPADFEARLNALLELPSGLRWARTRDGRMIQPAKWNRDHIGQMMGSCGRDADEQLRERLGEVQNAINTEPDLVFQWGDTLLLVEIKVLASEGIQQMIRQERLATLLSRLLGWTWQIRCIGPGAQPYGGPGQFVSWETVAVWFHDVPEIADAIRGATFRYGRTWRSLTADCPVDPAPTAFDRMVERWGEREPARVEPAPSAPSGHPGPYDVGHLPAEYFRTIAERCRKAGLWPVRTIWLGVTGVPYDRPGRMVKGPNWAAEDDAGRFMTNRDTTPSLRCGYDRTKMRAWDFTQVARDKGLAAD